MLIYQSHINTKIDLLFKMFAHVADLMVVITSLRKPTESPHIQPDSMQPLLPGPGEHINPRLTIQNLPQEISTGSSHTLNPHDARRHQYQHQDLRRVTVMLYFKFLVTARTQAHATFAVGGRTPEDNMLGKLAKKDGPVQNYGLMIDIEPEKDNDEARQKHKAALENDQRWKRIVANDLESIPLALLVFGAGLVVESHEAVQAVAMIVYTLARLAHTVVYAKGLQPWRSIVWIIGVLGIVVTAVNIVVSVLAK